MMETLFTTQTQEKDTNISMTLSKTLDAEAHLNEQIIGQNALIRRLIMALLVDGHILLEGPPGVAKTTAIKKLAEAVEAEFKRIQFTPDLLPADVTGSDMYNSHTQEFVFKPGPVFHNILLADEINRAPAKVQSALLEAMAERQVSVGNTSYSLPSLFMVLATQNPIDQQGTYPLPEAQLDRFLFKTIVSYPNAEQEVQIIDYVAAQSDQQTTRTVSMHQQDVIDARAEIAQVHLSEIVKEYIVQLVIASRDMTRYDKNFARFIAFGASPRASIALAACARAHAWLNARNYATPEDVQAFFFDVMRHRVILSFEAQAESMDTTTLLQKLLELVPCG